MPKFKEPTSNRGKWDENKIKEAISCVMEGNQYSTSHTSTEGSFRTNSFNEQRNRYTIKPLRVTFARCF